MHLTEKCRRIYAETLSIQVTIEDPKASKGVWVNQPKLYNLHTDWEIAEHYCVIDEELSYGDAIRIPAGQSGPK
jgi:hypothetical protein